MRDAGVKVSVPLGENKRVGAGVQIRFHGAWYRISNNPLEVWRALALCNKFDISAPAWASEYLTRVTLQIASLESSKRFDFDLADAMEFSGEALEKRKKFMRQRKVVRWIFDHTTADERADPRAMQRYFLDAAAEFDPDPKSDATIANWWREFHLHFMSE